MKDLTNTRKSNLPVKIKLAGTTPDNPIDVEASRALEIGQTDTPSRLCDQHILQTHKYLNDCIINDCLAKLLAPSPTKAYLYTYFMEYAQSENTTTRCSNHGINA